MEASGPSAILLSAKTEYYPFHSGIGTFFFFGIPLGCWGEMGLVEWHGGFQEGQGMGVHDWTRVDAGIFHSFHQAWNAELNGVLNTGLLPQGFYALIEQHAGKQIPRPGKPSERKRSGGRHVLCGLEWMRIRG